MTLRGWKQFTPFYFYTVAAAGLVAAAAPGEARPLTSTLTLFVCGLLSWPPLEYALHRFAFHRPARDGGPSRFLSASHRSHHDHPGARDQLFAGLRTSAPVALCYFLLAWAVLGGWRAAAYQFAGLVAGYFGYEWLHYQAHHRRPRLRPLRYLRRYHLLHHHQTPGLRFGVTSPVMDCLCGTFRPPGGRAPTP